MDDLKGKTARATAGAGIAVSIPNTCWRSPLWRKATLTRG
ncbi:hypothetical protein [Lelliottia nimipressuralis]